MHTGSSFLVLPVTTEAMGIWRFAGAFAVVERQGECGSKTAGMHVSQPMNIGWCYGFGCSFLFEVSRLSVKVYNLSVKVMVYNQSKWFYSQTKAYNYANENNMSVIYIEREKRFYIIKKYIL